MQRDQFFGGNPVGVLVANRDGDVVPLRNRDDRGDHVRGEVADSGHPRDRGGALLDPGRQYVGAEGLEAGHRVRERERGQPRIADQGADPLVGRFARVGERVPLPHDRLRRGLRVPERGIGQPAGAPGTCTGMWPVAGGVGGDGVPPLHGAHVRREHAQQVAEVVQQPDRVAMPRHVAPKDSARITPERSDEPTS